MLKITFILVLAITYSTLYAKDCPNSDGKYGDGIQYQNMFCKLFISADKTDTASYRNFTFTDTGLIQIFSNFPGTTNSNSTGARVYYLFPSRMEKEINSADETHLSAIHPSGVQFNFDKNGRPSSQDLKMKVSKEINSNNKSGVDIESYSKGLVVDIGYRMGNTPTLNKNATVTITDKNKKQCSFSNGEFHKIEKYKAELIYRTNESLHKFLAKKCPKLDISDLLQPAFEKIKIISEPSKLGTAPDPGANKESNDSARSAKPQENNLEDLVQSLVKERKSIEK